MQGYSWLRMWGCIKTTHPGQNQNNTISIKWDTVHATHRWSRHGCVSKRKGNDTCILFFLLTTYVCFCHIREENISCFIYFVRERWYEGTFIVIYMRKGNPSACPHFQYQPSKICVSSVCEQPWFERKEQKETDGFQHGQNVKNNLKSNS